MPDNNTLNRRQVLQLSGVGLAASVAGCLGGNGGGDDEEFLEGSC